MNLHPGIPTHGEDIPRSSVLPPASCPLPLPRARSQVWDCVCGNVGVVARGRAKSASTGVGHQVSERRRGYANVLKPLTQACQRWFGTAELGSQQLAQACDLDQATAHVCMPGSSDVR
eukprot:316773-Chlamydomonas_euryale.AAC.1